MTDDSWRNLDDDISARIWWARQHRTAFDKPAVAARALQIKPVTYRTYEVPKSHGGRVPPLLTVQAIARKYGVAWQWLLTGDGTPDDAAKSELGAIAEALGTKLLAVESDKRTDALRAVEGVIDAFTRKAS